MHTKIARNVQPRLWWLALLLLIAVCAGGVVLAHVGVQPFDAAPLLWFRDAGGQLAGPAWIGRFWFGVSLVGNPAGPVLAAGLTILGMVVYGRWRSGLLLAGALVSGVALTLGIKHWVGRPRPELVPHLVEVYTASFPSGHTLVSTLFYVGAAWLLAHFLRQAQLRWTLYVIATLLALATGVSRVALGVHYPSDVVASWLIGVAWLCLWFDAARHWWPQSLARAPAREWPLPKQRDKSRRLKKDSTDAL